MPPQPDLTVLTVLERAQRLSRRLSHIAVEIEKHCATIEKQNGETTVSLKTAEGRYMDGLTNIMTELAADAARCELPD